MTPTHGLTFCLYGGGDSMSQTDVYMTGRATGVLTYRNTDMFGYVDGLSFALQYQGKNNENTNNARGEKSLITMVML